MEILKLEPKPEPEEVEIRKLEWPAEGNLLADTPRPPSPASLPSQFGLGRQTKLVDESRGWGGGG